MVNTGDCVLACSMNINQRTEKTAATNFPFLSFFFVLVLSLFDHHSYL